MALSIVQNPNASFGEKALAGGYIGSEAIAHAGLVIGTAGLVCAATVPGCAKAVETVLGIGTAACADGNCTNEINPVIDFLSNQLNRVSHIMDTKHSWDRLITLSGNIAEDYKAIQPYLQQSINNGPVKQIGTTQDDLAIFQYVTKINGQDVVVNAFKTTNGVIQIIDAWVKTK